MGWESGKGLGAQGQGIVDPITVKSNSEKRGVGSTGNDGAWIAHQDDFAAVLAALNQEHGGDEDKKKDSSAEGSAEEGDEGEAAKSLEENSKKMRKRVHYHKFTRGKDLSRYSATDLDCILGSAAVKEKRKTAKEDDLEKKRIEEEELSQASEQKDGQETKSHGLVTIRGGNLNDYFAKKMAALKAKNSSETPNSLLLPSSPRPTLTSNGEEDVSMPAKESSKKKKRKLEPEEVAVADEDCEQPESKKSKKKKSKKEKEDLVEDTNLKPVEMEETKAERKARRKREKKLEKENARLQEEEVNECQVVSETKAEKKARKKREKLEEVAQDSADHDERKKSKKKKKDVEDTAPDCDDAEDDDGDSKVKKRTLLKTKSKNDGVDKIKESKLKKSELDGFKGANLLKMAGYGTH